MDQERAARSRVSVSKKSPSAKTTDSAVTTASPQARKCRLRRRRPDEHVALAETPLSSRAVRLTGRCLTASAAWGERNRSPPTPAMALSLPDARQLAAEH